MTISISSSTEINIWPSGSGLVGEIEVFNKRGLNAQGSGSLKALREAFNTAKRKAEEEGVMALWAVACGGERNSARKALLKRAGFKHIPGVGYVLKLSSIPDSVIKAEALGVKA